MARILPFKTRDQLTKGQLLEYCKRLIDEGDFIILVAHRDRENLTDVVTNLNFKTDRVGLKGILQDAQDAIKRVAPVPVFEGDRGG